MSDFRVEPTDVHDASCDCCGRQSRTVTGFVYRDDHAAAAYFVQWTVGAVDSHGANFDLIVGRWGEGATSSDRSAVALEFRRSPDGPAFMVVDASSRPAGQSELAGRALSREAVIGTPLARIAFDIVDAVWLHDGRIKEIVGDPG
jgi:hypothetical protein